MLKKVNMLLIMAVLLPVLALAKPTIVKPTIKSVTSFAIVVDNATLEAIRSSVEAYRDAIEKDGLATYIVSDNWCCPDDIKAILVKLAKGKMPIEGAVFLGDIPVAMTRDNQHLASAFKGDQNKDWKEYSSPSDRFYDDFDLKWNFIKQDEDLPHLFYYSLRADSPQKVCTDIYSGRIRATGDDKYKKLEKYLAKVVAAHAENNKLDDFLLFRGNAYNSESKEGWAGEQITLREQIPSLFTYGNTARFLDFETKYPVKSYLLEYLRRPTLDVALGHHHGSVTRQYLNNNQNAASVSEAIEMVKLYLRSKVRREKGDKAAAMEKWAAEVGVPVSWVDTTAATAEADKRFQREMDIYLEDIYENNLNPRFIMHDACYNGSFHKDDCVANAYLFCDGNTVAAHGNTLNSIQDKHPNAYLGLLASGLRIGQWARYAQNFLGAHLVGDPTYKFANTSTPDIDINTVLAVEGGNNEFWLNIIKNNKYAETGSDWIAMAVRKLADNKYENLEQLAMEVYKTSPFGSVRMECFKALCGMNASNRNELLILGLNDSYELVRRFCADYIGGCGDAELLPALVNAAINDRISVRVEYRASDNLMLYPKEDVVAEVKKQLAENKHIIDPEATMKCIMSSADWVGRRIDAILNTFTDSSVPHAERAQNISTLRNYNYHHIVPQIIAFIEDASQPSDLRVAAIEALGWFRASYQNGKIAEACTRLMKSDAPQEVKNEAEKTLGRLQF
ncbi:MAG: HEAT repeat domain-containing protein [Bacteroidales bacterium]|nr:HEAT repeat domain-containing protein [Bacteroidales bacterium]